jgi:hypothetical protein
MTLVRVLEIYPALIGTIQESLDDDNNHLAFKLLDISSKFNFLYTVAVFSDILRIINRTEKILQSNSLCVSLYIKELLLCIEDLGSLYVEDDRGVFLQEFLDDFDIETKSYRKNYLLQYTMGEEKELLQDARKIAKLIQEGIVNRFKGDTEGILEAFVMLDIPHLQERIHDLDSSASANYGNTELRKCVRYYNQFFESRNIATFGKNSKVLVESATLAEWKTLKNDIRKSFAGINPNIITKHATNPTHYPLLSDLYSFYMIIPLSTAECERVFSKMNTIKTDKRNCLNNESLNGFLLVSILGPDPADRDETNKFNTLLLEAIQHWREDKKRYFL